MHGSVLMAGRTLVEPYAFPQSKSQSTLPVLGWWSRILHGRRADMNGLRPIPRADVRWTNERNADQESNPRWSAKLSTWRG